MTDTQCRVLFGSLAAALLVSAIVAAKYEKKGKK